MPSPLHADTIPPLLEILSNPEHPAFAQALERITMLDMTTLDPATAPKLLAHIQATLDKLSASSQLTASQLTALRQGNKALKSYTQNR